MLKMNKILLDRFNAFNATLINNGQEPISKEKYIAHLELTLKSLVKNAIMECD